MSSGVRIVSRWLSTILVGAGCGGLFFVLGFGGGVFVVGVLLAFGGALFVGATNLATWASWLGRLPRPISREEFAELYGRGVSRAISVGLFGLGMAFGGWANSPGYLLLAGAAGISILLLTLDKSPRADR
jgi:hypothetical protein